MDNAVLLPNSKKATNHSVLPPAVYVCVCASLHPHAPTHRGAVKQSCEKSPGQNETKKKGLHGEEAGYVRVRLLPKKRKKQNENTKERASLSSERGTGHHVHTNVCDMWVRCAAVAIGVCVRVPQSLFLSSEKTLSVWAAYTYRGFPRNSLW